jgi:hypothetical protein
MWPAAGTRQKRLRFAHGQTDVMDDILKCAFFLAHAFDHRPRLAPKMIERRIDSCEQDIK